MSWLDYFWTAVWPNLAANILWIPMVWIYHKWVYSHLAEIHKATAELEILKEHLLATAARVGPGEKGREGD